MNSSQGFHHRHLCGYKTLQLKAHPRTFQKSWPRAQMLPALAVVPEMASSSSCGPWRGLLLFA